MFQKIKNLFRKTEYGVDKEDIPPYGAVGKLDMTKYKIMSISPLIIKKKKNR